MENIIIRQGDCMSLIKDLPDSSVDCVITDPPYNVLALDWDKQEINWKELSKELFRVLRYGGSAYIFGQTPFIFKVYEEMIKAKFEFRQDLVWVKNRGFSLATTIYTKFHENILLFWKSPKSQIDRFGQYIKKVRSQKEISLRQIGELCNEKWYHRGGHMYYETGLACPTKEQYLKLKEVLGLDNRFDNLFEKPIFNFEDIKIDGEPYKITREAQKLYGIKSNLGKYTQVNEGKRNPKTVLEYSIIQGGNEYTGHPTQKPIKLIRYLIKASTNENDLVLDCFAGSGTTLVACQELKRRGVGFEKETGYVSLTNKRLNQKNIHHFSNTQNPTDFVLSESLISDKRETAVSPNSKPNGFELSRENPSDFPARAFANAKVVYH